MRNEEWKGSVGKLVKVNYWGSDDVEILLVVHIDWDSMLMYCLGDRGKVIFSQWDTFDVELIW